jgi:hypothetical protein
VGVADGFNKSPYKTDTPWWVSQLEVMTMNGRILTGMMMAFLFVIPGKRDGELLTRDFVRLPNPSNVVGSVFGRRARGEDQVVVKGVH